MNEDVQEIRRLLAPANPSPQGALTGAAHDATGRAAFHSITVSSADADAGARTQPPAGSWLRARRATVRLIAVGGLAVALAAGVTVVENLGGTDENGRPRGIVQGLPAVPAANAQAVLTQAADAVYQRGFQAPRPDQWIFVETRYRRMGVPTKGEVRTPRSPLKTVLDRVWTSADGKKIALMEGGKLVISPTGGAMPPSDYASLAALPSDPDALLAWARTDRAPIAGGPDARAFDLLGSLLSGNGVLPPAQEAAVYRALAKIPGISLDRTAVDGLGRPVVSISSVIEGYAKREILLDRATYAYRGHRTIIIKDHTMLPGGGTFKKGTLESEGVRLAAGTVDRAGQHP